MPYVIIGLFENNERFREDVTADRFESIVDAKKATGCAVEGERIRKPE
jgi:hypothetical protein